RHTRFSRDWSSDVCSSDLEVALVLFQLGFESLEQGEGIGGATGKTSDYLAVVQAAYLSGIAFHNGVAKGYLAITAHGDFILPAYGNYRGHWRSSCLFEFVFWLYGGAGRDFKSRGGG